MYSWMEKIYIPESLGYLDVDGTPLTEFKGLKRVNFFVGSTGAGKSRLLRFLSSLEDPEVEIGGTLSAEIAPKLRRLKKQIAASIPDAEEYEAKWQEQDAPGATPQIVSRLKSLHELCDLSTKVKADSRGSVSSAYSRLEIFEIHLSIIKTYIDI